MAWQHPTEADWDRAADYRKHDTDPLPARFDIPLSTAMDVVVLVKTMPNYEHCAALIERYASGLAERNRLDKTVSA